MNQEYMKTRKILPLVLSMSLPMVISMAVNALYNIVDSYFVAKISEDAMTALALVFPMQNLVNAIVIGFAFRQTGSHFPYECALHLRTARCLRKRVLPVHHTSSIPC